MVNIIIDIHTDNKQNAILILEDGSCFFGKQYGYYGAFIGELCCNTSMFGYQEILTDPSYNDQIIAFTFPHVGNVGCNIHDNESKLSFSRGLVLQEELLCYSNYRATISFDIWLKNNHITGITGINVREIMQHLRYHGTQKAAIVHFDAEYASSDIDLQFWHKKIVNYSTTFNDHANVEHVKYDTISTHQTSINTNNIQIVLVDYGVKSNIIAQLELLGCTVTVVPKHATLQSILALNPAGVVLSNGYGDPNIIFSNHKKMLLALINTNLPIFGICMGHQLLALAHNFIVAKMPTGHRGANYAVMNIHTKKIDITVQNHGFCVLPDNSIYQQMKVSHTSLLDNSIEGLTHLSKKIFSVQFHPESSPGPQDSCYLFQQFINSTLQQ